MSKKSKAGKEKDNAQKPAKAGKASRQPQGAAGAVDTSTIVEVAATGDAQASKRSEKSSAKTQPAPAKSVAAASKPHGDLTQKQITLISKALADPTRMGVFRAIAKGGVTCGDLRTCSSISAATLSHHMKELETAGLIETERKGRYVSASLQRKTWKSYLGELKSLAG